jgi:two-component system response regulator FixJ
MDDRQRLVLVLDHDLGVRESLKFALEQDGVQVRTFGAAASLLQDAFLPQAGCLVLGHRPPAVNCFHIIAKLKARGHVLPVVVMTDHASPAFCRRAAGARVCHVIEKPAFDGSLLDCIHDALRLVRHVFAD